jgi:HTH-type transcriptional regulator / antitoxin HigA
MILSDRQYKVTQTELANLKDALAAASSTRRKDVEPWIQQMETDALKSQISEMEADLAEYDFLKSGQVSFAETSSLSELPKVLVQARIAKGMSQTDLAEKLGMKPQQIQRYEATDYMSASLARLIEVAAVLEVKISESFEGKASAAPSSIFAWSGADEIAWSRFPVKEMVKRKYFELPKGQIAADAAREFFFRAAGPQFATALHRKKVRSGNPPNEYALLAWQARILDKAKEVESRNRLGRFYFDDTWLHELKELTSKKDGPRLAQEKLAEHGISLIIEKHLPGTYLDGAAMRAASGAPVIGLTLRYDRIDNFWFVLLHELGHVFLHLNGNLKFDFFDEEDGADADDLEKQADNFALDTLIPPEAWDQCLSRFDLSEEAVKVDAANLGINAAIIAGRIRKERNDYTILNGLVGRDTVRTQFEEFE